MPLEPRALPGTRDHGWSDPIGAAQCLAHWDEENIEDGGWGYGEPDPAHSTSMTERFQLVNGSEGVGERQ